MTSTTIRGSDPSAGFTLIEILVVSLVGSIVASIAFISLVNAVDMARQRDTMADMRELADAIERYRSETGALPQGSGDLMALIPDAGNLRAAGDDGRPGLRDHWMNDYRYAVDPSGGYTIESFGKDGIDGPNITLASRFDFDQDIVLVNGSFVAAPE